MQKENMFRTENNQNEVVFSCQPYNLHPTLEKLKGHIALGLSVCRPFVRPFKI